MAKEPILSNRIRRKSRKEKRNPPSVNKYAHLVPPKKGLYNSKDKTYRELAFMGVPGQIFEAGTKLTFHGRLYEIISDVTIPKSSILPPMSEDGKHMVFGRCKLVAYIN